MKRKIILICFAVLMIATVVSVCILAYFCCFRPSGQASAIYALYVLYLPFAVTSLFFLLLSEGEVCHLVLYLLSGKEQKCKGKTILNILSLAIPVFGVWIPVFTSRLIVASFPIRFAAAQVMTFVFLAGYALVKRHDYVRYCRMQVS